MCPTCQHFSQPPGLALPFPGGVQGRIPVHVKEQVLLAEVVSGLPGAESLRGRRGPGFPRLLPVLPVTGSVGPSPPSPASRPWIRHREVGFCVYFTS